jgi:hypothetical protein
MCEATLKESENGMTKRGLDEVEMCQAKSRLERRTPESRDDDVEPGQTKREVEID